jgi:hypothetical protein
MKPSLLLLASLLATLAGCSGDDEPLTTQPVPLRECPEHDYSKCDIREPACQDRLLSLAACVFGSSEMPSVPIRVLSEAELRAELESELGEPTPEEAAKNAVLEGVLRDLDLAAEGALSTQASIDNVIESFDGLYRDAEQGIILLDRGQARNDLDSDVLLFHELVHALQDAEYDLNALDDEFATSTDAALSWRSLVEGQATWYQYRVAAAMLGYDTANFDFHRLFEDLRHELVGTAQEDESPYIASFGTFPYAYGTNLMYEAWRADGAGFETALFGDPPLTTIEVMRRSLGVDEPAVTPPTFSDPVPTEDFTLLEHDSFGAWMLNLCFHEKGLSEVRWLGDHIWIYTAADGSAAWLWQIELEHSPSTLPDALELSMPTGVSVEGLGERLFVVSGGREAPFLIEAGRAFLNGTD